MELIDLIRIEQIAEEMGFSGIVESEKYACFQKVTARYKIEIIYDYRRKTYRQNVIYLKTSTDETYNTSDVQDYICDLQKAKLVERKVPETWKECEQLKYTQLCGTCVYGNTRICEEENKLYEKGIQAGELKLVQDSNNEYGYKKIW